MEVCRDSLWNSTISWETNSPRLSSCLQSVLEVLQFIVLIMVAVILNLIQGGGWFSPASAAATLAPHIISTPRPPRCSTRGTERDAAHPLSLPHSSSLFQPLHSYLFQPTRPVHKRGGGSHCFTFFLQPPLLRHRGIHSTRSKQMCNVDHIWISNNFKLFEVVAARRGQHTSLLITLHWAFLMLALLPQVMTHYEVLKSASPFKPRQCLRLRF